MVRLCSTTFLNKKLNPGKVVKYLLLTLAVHKNGPNYKYRPLKFWTIGLNTRFVLQSVNDKTRINSFPGPLNANTGTLSLASQSFVADGVLYEVLLEARKFTQTNVNFTRVSTARIQVNIVAGIPPIMEIL